MKSSSNYIFSCKKKKKGRRSEIVKLEAKGREETISIVYIQYIKNLFEKRKKNTTRV